MSYRATFYFKKVENKLVAYEFCDMFSKMFLDENIAKIWIENHKLYIPELRYKPRKNEDEENNARLLEFTNDYWLRKLFSLWKKMCKIINEEFYSLISGTALYLQKSECKSLTEEVLTSD